VKFTRPEMLKAGMELMARWCALNGVAQPRVEIYEGRETDFGVCAYYRDDVIHIWPDACAHVGYGGRAWSYPGYVVDRTPYGVIQHELGHHVDDAAGSRGGRVAHRWRAATKEEPLTGYCPNNNEWFAEMFRLFVTNPELLSLVRPRTHHLMQMEWPHPVETRRWQDVLNHTERQVNAAWNKISNVQRKEVQDGLF